MLSTSTVEKLPGGKAVIVVSGSLTLGTSLKLLDSQIQNLIAGDVNDLLLDLSQVEYADSGGLGLLVHTHGRLSAKNGTLRLSGVQPRVMDLIRLTKMDTILTIESTAGGSPTVA